jgi:phage tail-like protein
MEEEKSNEDKTHLTAGFRFDVDFGEPLKSIPFQEVSGLDLNQEAIEYRNTNHKIFATDKKQGIPKYNSVILKRGMVSNGNAFSRFQEQIQTNTFQRETVVVKLLNETGDIVIAWGLENAYPTHINFINLHAEESEVAIESMEIAYETLTVVDG